MNQQASKNKAVIAIVIIGVVLASLYFYSNRGYGKVSYPTYQVATALYGACLAKSPERIQKIESLLTDPSGAVDVQAIPENELRWLEAIIHKANNDQWESAAASAKRMMDDQLTPAS